ncbi:MAG: hypothetical protein MUC79_15005, partial [Thiobacillaceae bacterium]|nr:hypothetical protein [Thiobacillaceae bacterium]
MSSSERLPLHVVAADAGTEIFLVDADFRRLASAVGELRTEVEPGLYKVRFRSGDAMADRLVEVAPGQGDVLVQGEPLRFASALPLPDTRTSHKYHQAAWSHAWGPPDLNLGSGSRLFVMARDADKRPDERPHHMPWRGLSLHAPDGRMLLDFAEAPQRNPELAFASANLQVDPGTYLLRVDTDLNGVLEMPLVASPDWQTQVALRSRTISRRQGDLRTEGRSSRSVRRADLGGATVLMARPGYHADPSGEQDRLTELARLGLVQGRATLRPDDLRSMLWAKRDNPMLGLYGAHMLLQGDERDSGLLHEVVGNLESLLGPHPDVAALRLALARLDGQTVSAALRFDLPPMLARSWDLVVEASVGNPELVSADSFAGRIAGNRVSSRHWLIWRRTAALVQALRKRPGEPPIGADEPVIANVLKSMSAVVGDSPLRDNMLAFNVPSRFNS